jgi:hypothetical protein
MLLKNSLSVSLLCGSLSIISTARINLHELRISKAIRFIERRAHPLRDTRHLVVADDRCTTLAGPTTAIINRPLRRCCVIRWCDIEQRCWMGTVHKGKASFGIQGWDPTLLVGGVVQILGVTAVDAVGVIISPLVGAAQFLFPVAFVAFLDERFTVLVGGGKEGRLIR